MMKRKLTVDAAIKQAARLSPEYRKRRAELVLRNREIIYQAYSGFSDIKVNDVDRVKKFEKICKSLRDAKLWRRFMRSGIYRHHYKMAMVRAYSDNTDDQFRFGINVIGDAESYLTAEMNMCKAEASEHAKQLHAAELKGREAGFAEAKAIYYKEVTDVKGNNTGEEQAAQAGAGEDDSNTRSGTD